MPNWVSNNVTITASKKLLEKIKAEVKGEDSEFDFNRIAPMPKELENTRSPMVAISKKEYKEQELRIIKGELKEHEKSFGVSRCLTQELIDEYNRKFGACDWYSWHLANWGTKWNACDVYVNDNFISFNTAWSTPFDLMVKLSEKYPKATFEVEYADEDFGHNVGKYTLINGEEVDVFLPKGGSREALELAMEIQYGGVSDYDFDDVFVDLYGDDELNGYVANMIDIAYDNDIIPFEGCDWDKLVLERFKEKALADEKYEIIATIQNELDRVEEEK